MFTPSFEVLTPKHAKSVTGGGATSDPDLGKPSVCVDGETAVKPHVACAHDAHVCVA